MGYSTLHTAKRPVIFRATISCFVPLCLVFMGSSVCLAQNSGSAKNRNADGWPLSIYQTQQQNPEQKVDLGKIYAKRPRKNQKTGLVKQKNVEKNLSTLREEKKQLEKMLKKLDRESRRLRFKSRLKKKRRCA